MVGVDKGGFIYFYFLMIFYLVLEMKFRVEVWFEFNLVGRVRVS